MDVCGGPELSSETEKRLHQISSKLDSENSFNASKNKLSLLNYGSSPDSDKVKVNVKDVNSNVKYVLNTIKESLSHDTIVPETLFADVPEDSLKDFLFSLITFLDEFKFCTFCKSVACWKEDVLVDHCLTLVVLPKLKEITEAPGCVIFSIKELTISKPLEVCRNVLIPLLSDEEFHFTDAELLSGIFPVLPSAQKDLLILIFKRKNEFSENDWLLLHPIIKDLTPSNKMNLLECIEKFSKKFTKSLVFGRFLVNFCHNLEFINNKDSLKEVIGTHETLLKIQALKCFESV